MPPRKNEPDIAAFGYVIADSGGRIQHHTLRPNPAAAWQALWGRKLKRIERENLKKRGFLSVAVFVRNYFRSES